MTQLVFLFLMSGLCGVLGVPLFHWALKRADEGEPEIPLFVGILFLFLFVLFGFCGLMVYCSTLPLA